MTAESDNPQPKRYRIELAAIIALMVIVAVFIVVQVFPRIMNIGIETPAGIPAEMK